MFKLNKNVISITKKDENLFEISNMQTGQKSLINNHVLDIIQGLEKNLI